MTENPLNRPNLDIPAYVDQTAELINLPLDPVHREGTIANFERICALALPVLEFPLPETIEAAPVFRPDL